LAKFGVAYSSHIALQIFNNLALETKMIVLCSDLFLFCISPFLYIFRYSLFGGNGHNHIM